MTKQEFIQSLIDKNLSFGYYNDEFIPNPNLLQMIGIKENSHD